MVTKSMLQDNWTALSQEFKELKDFEQQELKSKSKQVQLLFLKSTCDSKKIQKDIILPFYQTSDMDAFTMYIESLPGCTLFKDHGSAVEQILYGQAAILLSQAIYFYNVNNAVNTSIDQASVEKSFQGPQLGFSEHIETNLNLLRNRYPTPALTYESDTVGTQSKTRIIILYDKQFVDQDVLAQVKQQISSVNQDVVQAIGGLQKAMSKEHRGLFPTSMITERPDRAILNIAQGKVVVMMEGTPFVLIAPAVFYDFFSAMDDVYTLFWVSRFLITLRYIGFFITTISPAVYVAIVSYNPGILRVQLTIAIAGSRAAVPFPSYLEVLFMLFMMELLTEASLRLPQAIGSTATTVGGLILGQAAVQANIASSIMIIIVSAVAISNFVIPISAMSIAVRVIRYPLIILATFFGLVGVVAGYVFFVLYLCNLRSFGKPFLRITMGSSTRIEKIHEEVKR